MQLKIKVCGMRNSQNILELAKLKPDYIGFIFYAKSPRYAASLDKAVLALLPASIKKVGIFVNESVEIMLETATKYSLNALQLHGNETAIECLHLREKDYTIIKAFSIEEAIDFEKLTDYEGACDYFLFDTKTPQHGGSGLKFDWSLLENYKGNTPFFLSGGIGLDDVEAIKQITHPQFVAIDINSKFETEPGFKDIEKVKTFKERLTVND